MADSVYSYPDLGEWALVKLYRTHASKRRRALHNAPVHPSRPVGRADLNQMIEIVFELRRRDRNHPLADLLHKEDELQAQLMGISGDGRDVPSHMKAELKELRAKINAARERK